MKTDPIKLEIYNQLFAAIAEEMGAALGRTGFSPNIKERRDFSCAVFDRHGQLLAQAAHIPVHLGSQPESVRCVLAKLHLQPGDLAIVNDPYEGGTHLPDITTVAPLYCGDGKRPEFYLSNRAHHSDVGGMTPGSMPLATDIFQEGVRIPPIKLLESGKINPSALELLLANVRTPDERRGDLNAQIAANEVGARRLLELVDRNGIVETRHYSAALLDYAERMTRKAIAAIPDGAYQFEDFLDDDGIHNQPVKIKVTVRIQKDRATVDFTGSDTQVTGVVNCNFAIALSAVFYVFRCLMPDSVPTNAGCMRPLTVIAPPGTVVNARFPAAMSGGNVETSQRLVDVLLGALAKALPDRIGSASYGTMNNVLVGGVDPRLRRPFTYYETVAGGMGARPGKPGLDAVHMHMTNTLNTPAEAMEIAYPLRLTEYSIARSTGGTGCHFGGNGLVRELEFLSDAIVTLITDRRVTKPYGLAGGKPGAQGVNILIRNGKHTRLPGKCTVQVKVGDRLRVQTPGGGGWGAPKKTQSKSHRRK